MTDTSRSRKQGMVSGIDDVVKKLRGAAGQELQDRIARGAALRRDDDRRLHRLAGLLWDEFKMIDPESKKFEDLGAPSQNVWLRLARVAVIYVRSCP